MKEVTRIHIAKQAYDIETDAKKHFEAYMKKLEQYAGEPEILTDIEIRITELLAERGVKKGGVITADDVAEIRTILGEPEAFADAGEVPDEYTGKRLYRDMDGAVLAGVLSGIAKYFAVDPVWVRLAFVLLLLLSFGTAILLYIVLWLVVPPARTATEKLQLAGLPVTLEALRERVATNDVATTRMAGVLKTALFVGASIVSIMVTIGVLTATVSVAVAVLVYGAMNSYIVGHSAHAWMVWTAFWLFVASGFLLALLVSLAAAAFIKRQLPKRMVVAMAMIVVSGLLVFSTGIAMAVGYTQLRSDEARAAMVTQRGALPELASVRKVVAIAQSASGWAHDDNDRMQIDYRVTTGAPRYELRTQYSGGKPTVTVTGDTARIAVKPVGETVDHFGYVPPQLTIYGPALESIDVQQGNFSYMLDDLTAKQEQFTVATLPLTSVTVYGSYEKIDVRGGGNVDVSMSSVRQLAIDMEGGMSHVEAGVVHALSVTHPDACPVQQDESQRPQVIVQGVSSGEMTYNGSVGPVRQYATPCGEITIMHMTAE